MTDTAIRMLSSDLQSPYLLERGTTASGVAATKWVARLIPYSISMSSYVANEASYIEDII